MQFLICSMGNGALMRKLLFSTRSRSGDLIGDAGRTRNDHIGTRVSDACAWRFHRSSEHALNCIKATADRAPRKTPCSRHDGQPQSPGSAG
jgi:hypothetical protein